MANKSDGNDPLFDKLDNLMQSAHARKPHDPPPLLTDAVPEADESAIPTLTDAVEPPETAVGEHREEQGRENDLVEPPKMISAQLVAAIDREMEKLSKELPVHGHKLAVLHRSLRFALPELVRLRWEDSAEQDTNAEKGRDADPDQ
jgi:hypothetical protein